MRIKKTGWAVWDKISQRFVLYSGMIVCAHRDLAWLKAGKERKGSRYKVVKINLTVTK